MTSDLLIDHRGPVTTLTLNRPPLNLLTLSLLEEFLAALEALREREETRVVVIRGSGTRAFCAGADLKIVGQRDERSAETWRGVGRRIVDAIERCPKPV